MNGKILANTYRQPQLEVVLDRRFGAEYPVLAQPADVMGACPPPLSTSAGVSPMWVSMVLVAGAVGWLSVGSLPPVARSPARQG